MVLQIIRADILRVALRVEMLFHKTVLEKGEVCLNIIYFFKMSPTAKLFNRI